MRGHRGQIWPPPRPAHGCLYKKKIGAGTSEIHKGSHKCAHHAPKEGKERDQTFHMFLYFHRRHFLDWQKKKS